MNLSKPELKHSPIFPEEYMVSSNGDVLSLRTGKLLKPNTDKSGYLYYVLCVNGNRKTIKAHRLVALTFIPNPDNKPAVDHINGIRTNNRADNLRWVTNKENTNNPNTRHGFINVVSRQLPTMYEASKKRNFGRKRVLITYADGTKRSYPSLKEASKDTGKNYSKLSEILNGKRKQDSRFEAFWEVPIAVTREHSTEDEAV